MSARLQSRVLCDLPPKLLEQQARKRTTRQSAARGEWQFAGLKADMTLAEYVKRFEENVGLVPSQIPTRWMSITFTQEKRTERAQTRDLVDYPQKMLDKLTRTKWFTRQSSTRPSTCIPKYYGGELPTLADYTERFEELNHLVKA